MSKVPDNHYLKFTQDAIERLQPPHSGRKTYWDSLLPGFGCRVSARRASGHVRKTFFAIYRVADTGKQVFETIGSLNFVSVVNAREQARESMRQAQQASIQSKTKGTRSILVRQNRTARRMQ